MNFQEFGTFINQVNDNFINLKLLPCRYFADNCAFLFFTTAPTPPLSTASGNAAQELSETSSYMNG